MTTSNLIAYGTAGQLACTSMVSLATGTAVESASQTNTSLKYFDWLVTLTFTIASGSPSTAGPAVNVYANGSVDGTLWPIIQLSSGAVKATAGTDGSLGALGTPPNLRLIGSFGLQTTTSSGERTFRTEPFSVASAFGGVVPQSFSVIVENQTGVAFSSSTATTAAYVEADGIYTTNG